jgi:hypothetical protein
MCGRCSDAAVEARIFVLDQETTGNAMSAFGLRYFVPEESCLMRGHIGRSALFTALFTVRTGSSNGSCFSVHIPM